MPTERRILSRFNGANGHLFRNHEKVLEIGQVRIVEYAYFNSEAGRPPVQVSPLEVDVSFDFTLKNTDFTGTDSKKRLWGRSRVPEYSIQASGHLENGEAKNAEVPAITLEFTPYGIHGIGSQVTYV